VEREARMPGKAIDNGIFSSKKYLTRKKKGKKRGGQKRKKRKRLMRSASAPRPC